MLNGDFFFNVLKLRQSIFLTVCLWTVNAGLLTLSKRKVCQFWSWTSRQLWVTHEGNTVIRTEELQASSRAASALNWWANSTTPKCLGFVCFLLLFSDRVCGFEIIHAHSKDHRTSKLYSGTVNWFAITAQFQASWRAYCFKDVQLICRFVVSFCSRWKGMSRLGGLK